WCSGSSASSWPDATGPSQGPRHEAPQPFPHVVASTAAFDAGGWAERRIGSRWERVGGSDELGGQPHLQRRLDPLPHLSRRAPAARRPPFTGQGAGYATLL